MSGHFLTCILSNPVMALEIADDIVYHYLERGFVIFSVVSGFQTPEKVTLSDSKLVRSCISKESESE